jgi:hypothetical protein
VGSYHAIASKKCPLPIMGEGSYQQETHAALG